MIPENCRNVEEQLKRDFRSGYVNGEYRNQESRQAAPLHSQSLLFNYSYSDVWNTEGGDGVAPEVAAAVGSDGHSGVTQGGEGAESVTVHAWAAGGGELGVFQHGLGVGGARGDMAPVGVAAEEDAGHAAEVKL